MPYDRSPMSCRTSVSRYFSALPAACCPLVESPASELRLADSTCDFTESSASNHRSLKKRAYNSYMSSCTGGENRKTTKGNQATFFHSSLLPFLLPNNRSDPMRSGYFLPEIPARPQRWTSPYCTTLGMATPENRHAAPKSCFGNSALSLSF